MCVCVCVCVFVRYLSLHPTRQDLTQGLFYCGGFRERGGHALLDHIGHRLTGCTMSQMTLLGLRITKCNVSPARMPAHSLN